MLRKWRQMGHRQFPLAAGAMLGALGQNFRGEHAVDLEKLELHRVAARLGRGIDKGERARQVAAMVARGFGDEAGGTGFLPDAGHRRTPAIWT